MNGDQSLEKWAGNLMLTTENKALVRRWLEECYNKGNVAAADELVAPDYVNHSAPHGQMPGLEAEKQYIAMIRSAIPDFHLAIEDQIAEGDRVVTRLTASGTFAGGLEDIPSTAAIGKQVRVTEILIHRIADGKAVEGGIESDLLGLWQQLGALPSGGDCFERPQVNYPKGRPRSPTGESEGEGDG
jgi:predicted ester cyclase